MWLNRGEKRGMFEQQIIWRVGCESASGAVCREWCVLRVYGEQEAARAGRRWGAANGGGAACVTSESSGAHQSPSALGRGTKKRKTAALEGAESRASVSWSCTPGWGCGAAAVEREPTLFSRATQLTYGPGRTHTRSSHAHSVPGVLEPQSPQSARATKLVEDDRLTNIEKKIGQCHS
jgi:hypothetical protein